MNELQTQAGQEAAAQNLTNDKVIEQIAEMCHWANRSWCHMNGDDSQPKWEDAPDWMRESAIKGIHFLLANPHASPEDQHEAWCRDKYEAGWKYGATKDPDVKEHPCLVAYGELPLDQQVKDSIYQGVANGMIAKYTAVGRLAIRRELTSGEVAMDINFNVGGNLQITRIKRACAYLHDLCLQESSIKETQLLNREASESKGGIPSPLARMGRLMAMALTDIENACMHAVKAVTR